MKFIPVALAIALTTTTAFANASSEATNQLNVIGTLMGRMFGCEQAASSQIVIPILNKLNEDAGLTQERMMETVLDSAKLAEQKQRGSDPWKCNFVQEQYDKITGK